MKIAADGNRFWLEIVMIGAGMACALALLLACLGTVGSAAGEPEASAGTAPAETFQTHAVPPQAQPEVQEPGPQPLTHSREQTYEGMLTCSRCGARHSAALGKSAADCSRSCVHGGAEFALVEGEKTYLLVGDTMLMNKFAGQRARVVGTLNGNKITVSEVGAGT